MELSDMAPFPQIGHQPRSVVPLHPGDALPVAGLDIERLVLE